MRKSTGSLICLVSFLSAGCATESIEMSGDAAAIPAFKTFRVHEEQVSFAEPVSDAERTKVSAELRAAAVDALQARGYREIVAADAPVDVLVTLGASSRTTLAPAETDETPHITPVDTNVLTQDSTPMRTAGGDIPPPGVGREGDIVLYLLDPTTKRVIWRASSSGSATSAGEALRKARSTYRAMVKKLPEAGSSAP